MLFLYRRFIASFLAPAIVYRDTYLSTVYSEAAARSVEAGASILGKSGQYPVSESTLGKEFFVYFLGLFNLKGKMSLPMILKVYILLY
jgi:hypothetical protein